MQLSPYLHSLIGQALIGTDKQIFDYDLVPDGLRQAVEAIASQESDPSVILLKQASLILNTDKANATAQLNSFAVSTMAEYQQALVSNEVQKLSEVAKSKLQSKDQTNLASQSSVQFLAHVQSKSVSQVQKETSLQLSQESTEDKVATNHSHVKDTGDTKGTGDTDNSLSLSTQSAQGANASKGQETILNKALLNKIKNSKSPVPLLVDSTSSLPYFPEKVGKLIKSASIDQSGNLLFWLLTKLSAYNMQLNPVQACALFANFFSCGQPKSKINFAMPRFGEVTSAELFSRFMLQELMFKVGGASLSYLLSCCVVNNYGSIWPQLAYQSCLLGLSTKDWDDALIFSRVNISESQGIFLKLRWTNPDLSRELILKKVKRLKPEQGMEMVLLMRHNLSMDDVPCLTQLMLKDKDWWCISKARDVLNLLPETPQAQLCAKLCFKYLHFDGAKWQLTPIEFDEATKAQLESLGLHRRVAVLSVEERNRQALTVLLEGMTWADLRSLAQTDSDEEALKRWATFHKTLNLYPADGYKINMLLGRRIALSRDKSAVWAFLHNSFMISGCADVVGSLLMVLSLEQRMEYLKERCFKFNYLDVSWFVELNDCPFDFKTLDDKWSLALLDAILEGVMVQCSVNIENAHLLGMFLSYDCVDVLETKLASYKQQQEELKNKLNKLQSLEAKLFKKPLSADTIREKLDDICNKISLITKILKILKAKQRMEEVITRSLPSH